MNADESELPQAVLRPERRISWLWLVPIAAALLAVWIGYRSWLMSGLTITVVLEQGHGLKAGADIRYRGIVVGQVRELELTDDLRHIRATAALQRQAARLARAGSRFWVVRPQLGIRGMAGLDTLVGPRYLAVLPGDGATQRHFLALADPPIVQSIAPGDLEIILEARDRGSLSAGAPVLYRKVPVGTILSVGLSSDGGVVEARAHVGSAFAQLIRPETRFWSVGGFQADMGIRGLTLRMDSVDALLTGGVGLATPPRSDDVVRTGHRFALDPEPEDEWLDWQPLVAIGNALMPPGYILPSPQRAVTAWTQGRWLKSERTRRGWVLQTDEGLLAPADMVQPAGQADDDTSVLEVSGQPIPLTDEPLWSANGLAMVPAQVTEQVWPDSMRRAANEPEDCLAVADPTSSPLSLAAARMKAGSEGTWSIDPSIAVEESWHGAVVVSRRDGRLVGIILVTDGTLRVALLP